MSRILVQECCFFLLALQENWFVIPDLGEEGYVGIVIQSEFNPHVGGCKQSSEEVIFSHYLIFEKLWKQDQSSAAYTHQNMSYFSHSVLGSHYYDP